MLAPWFTRKEKETIAMDLLLVDDSKTMRLLVHRAIRQAGYRGLTVCEAENGADALEKLKTLKPRLILSDWNMPEMSGIDFLRKLRAENNITPFGFITSEASPKFKDLAISSGASFIIIKPFGVDEVQAALEPILGEA
jgi:two-component system chemotaxis response regulator CheY